MPRYRGTCIAIDGHGVLLRGESSAGKSDLALRLIDVGGELISDDYTELAAEDGRLMGTAPATLHGLIEVRGLGVVRLPARSAAPVVAVVDLLAADQVERMPPVRTEVILGVTVPLFQITASEASAAAKVRLIVKLASGAIMLVE
ncbi:MAG: HPr kinase/phosphatase C-terminal domain-containing protein [Rhodospirillales bacterium]